MPPLTKSLFDKAHSFIYMYSEKPFQLSSGKMSHHYFNCKKITLHPEFLYLAVQAICEELIPENNIPIPEAIGGLTLGADPLAYGISLYYYQKNIRCFPCIVRKEIKHYGTQKQIEGEIDSISEVIVLDDVITTGGSTLKAVDAFRKAGKNVRYAICLVDREEGGKENLLKENIELYSLWKKTDFIKNLNDNK
ncbi:MAG: orotate phosphoribosyltransferase [Leptospiraceae bacterium]|nr:MAG: orotate phosphoribosyltransferase [Leptospiraceae bacterium]